MATSANSPFIIKTAGEFAKRFRAKYRAKTLVDTREILIYKDGRYQPENGHIEASVEASFGDAATNALVSEIRGHIERSTFTRRDQFDSDPEWLNLENCMLNIRTCEQRPHSPDFLAAIRIPVKYDPKAKCPQFLKFLDEIAPNDKDTILDYVAYCTWRGLPFKKALLLVGEKDNGKSTLIRYLTLFLGVGNVSNVPLQKLEQDKFAASGLYGKLLNTCADLPTKPLEDTSIFRQLTGNDRIMTEKKFKDAFEFTYFGKLVFSANKLPYVYDDLTAFFERWIIVYFPNKFEGAKADPNKLDKISSEEEKSGVLNVLLERLPRVLQSGITTKEKTVEEIREKYYSYAESTIDTFFEDAVEEDENYIIRKEDLYLAYRAYCSRYNKSPDSEIAFGRKLKHRRASLTNQPYKSHQIMEGGKRFRIWDGLRVSKEWIKQHQTYIDNERTARANRNSLHNIP